MRGHYPHPEDLNKEDLVFLYTLATDALGSIQETLSDEALTPAVRHLVLGISHTAMGEILYRLDARKNKHAPLV